MGLLEELLVSRPSEVLLEPGLELLQAVLLALLPPTLLPMASAASLVEEKVERAARVARASLVLAAKVEKEEKVEREEKAEREERVVRAFSEAKEAKEARERAEA